MSHRAPRPTAPTRGPLTRRRFLSISAAALATVGPGTANAAPPVRWQGRAMGADVSLTLYAPPEQARAALQAVRDVIARAEALFSLYDPGSALSRLNRTGALSDPAPDFHALLRLCDQVHRVTDGRFDPSVQPRWQALARAQTPPDTPGWPALEHRTDRVVLAPAQALTFNGIAQGFATDRARDALRAHGLTRALINIGEYAAIGGPFRLGLADPRLGLVGVERLGGGRARATSSPGAMSLPAGAAHIVDPAGQRTPRWSTASVDADSAGLADGLSTAFCLMTRGEIARTLTRLARDGHAARATLVAQNGRISRLGEGMGRAKAGTRR